MKFYVCKLGGLCLLLFFFYGCNNNNTVKSYKIPQSYDQAISLAGANADKFEAVVDHYKKDPSDSLKLKAAYFLISNIPYHSSKNGFFSSNIMENLISKYRKEQINKGVDIEDYWALTYLTRDRFSVISDSLKKLNFKNDDEPTRDIEVIDTAYLIENIDLAFLAYDKIPDNYKVNFEDFCNYILPYRDGNEPIEPGKRKELFHKYSWVFEELKVNPFDEVVEKIYNETDRIQTSFATFEGLKGNLGYNQLEKIRLGRCGDLVNYYVHLFRSLGIASGTVYNPGWGNRHHTGGHSWFFVKHGDTIISAETGDKFFTWNFETIKVSSMPKIYRKTFKKVDENGVLVPKNDLTSLYRKTSDIVIENIFLDSIGNKDLKLCVFKSLRTWQPVSDASFIDNNHVEFNNVAKGILYAVASFDENKKRQLINNPFYLNFSGDIEFLAPSSKKVDTSYILRKDAPFLPQKPDKIPRIRSVNACILQGSNTLNGKFNDIYDIKDYNSTQNIKYRLTNLKDYKYYRLSCNEEIVHLANFKLLSKDLSPINKYRDIFSELKWGQKTDKVIDSSQLTFIEQECLEIIYEVKPDTEIGGFEIQARNDDNHINVGEKYKLFLWDGNWKSVETRIANDTVLTFKNLPANSLYFLRNLTKGKEETIFTIDDKGNQFWFSVSDINEIL